MDHEQLRLGSDLLDAMRVGVRAAIENGAQFVAPAHLLVGVLADPRVGPAIADLVPREKLLHAIEEAPKRLPGVVEVPEGTLPEGEHAPFARYDTLAFHAPDGNRVLYLDGEAFRLFIEGARRAGEAYHTRHLVMGFAAEAVKDRELLELFGADPAKVMSAMVDLAE
ncbi:MAG TPA: Clp protease N-terminal domain-containing protein [Candidatus Sulfotelmatobacter sp.]|nr:Clp protease N-terminal domain-containing protein [Candidatus Sulfotelmatobacter sp.]